MGILGFPNQAEVSAMMGFVTEEDREKWERMKASSDRNLEAARSGMSARQLAAQSATPAMTMAERSVYGDLQAAKQEEARMTQPKRTKRTTTTFTSEEPLSSDDHGMEY